VEAVNSSSGAPLDLDHPADDERLTVEVRTVVAAARRRAVRDGDRHADTAHLLHSLLEHDPRAREACDDGTGRVVRVLGYLVQRSVGYGMRWSGSVEDSGALPVVGPRRPDGEQEGQREEQPRRDAGSYGVSGEGAAPAAARHGSVGGAVAWSPAAAAALQIALAAHRGRGQAAGTDLLDALVADPGCRAVEVLAAAGLDVSRYRGDGPVAT
jgi:hypothetical protein